MGRIFTAEPGFIPTLLMAQSGEMITHGELEARANKIAHISCVFRGLKQVRPLRRLHGEPSAPHDECGIGGRAFGPHHCTNVNSYLTAGELAYIVNNSLSQVLTTSRARSGSRAPGAAQMPCESSAWLSTAAGGGDVSPQIWMKRQPLFRTR